MIRRAGGPDDQRQRSRLSKWFALASGLLGSFLGVATNLYSAEFRRALEISGKGMTVAIVPVVVSASVAAGSTAFAYWLFVRRRSRAGVGAGQLVIRTDAVRHLTNEQDSVLGRALQYLEATSRSRSTTRACSTPSSRVRSVGASTRRTWSAPSGTTSS